MALGVGESEGGVGPAVGIEYPTRYTLYRAELVRISSVIIAALELYLDITGDGVCDQLDGRHQETVGQHQPRGHLVVEPEDHRVRGVGLHLEHILQPSKQSQ